MKPIFIKWTQGGHNYAVPAHKIVLIEESHGKYCKIHVDGIKFALDTSISMADITREIEESTIE